MIQAIRDEQEIYLSNFSAFEEQRKQADPPWLSRIRKEAFLRFSELGFPTTRQEEWKYTNVRPLGQKPFRTAPDAGTVSESELHTVFLGDLACPRLVFVDGRFCAPLSSLEFPPGIRVESLASLLDSEPGWLETHLARLTDFREEPFNALNTAFLNDGAVVRVERGEVIEEPVLLLFISSGQDGVVSHPRTLVVAEETSQATVVEAYGRLAEGGYFVNPVTELVAADGAVVEHLRVQADSHLAYHVGSLQISVNRNANCRSHNIQLGSLLSRLNLTASLDGEGADCGLNGLYLLKGRQHVDNHTRVEHAVPHGSSRELYKGIVDESAEAVFHGRIIVDPGAQKTDSKQTNNNLLLSDEALVHTTPQLEIYADDVKCTHGATIGQLDSDALFYLRSRGIGEEAARSLLIYAFASEMLGRIGVQPVADRLRRYVSEWLPQGNLIREAVKQ